MNECVYASHSSRIFFVDVTIEDSIDDAGFGSEWHVGSTVAPGDLELGPFEDHTSGTGKFLYTFTQVRIGGIL